VYNNCTSEALVAAYEFTVMAKLGKSAFVAMSRLFLYFQERLIEGDINEDGGVRVQTEPGEISRSMPYETRVFRKDIQVDKIRSYFDIPLPEDKDEQQIPRDDVLPTDEPL